MKFKFSLIISSWSIGLYWLVCYYLFPINKKINKKQINIILLNQTLQTIFFLMTRQLFSDNLYPKNITSLFFRLILFIFTEEILFYYSHRLLHNRWFYKNIHYIHHQWKTTYSDIALYSNPIEHMINISCPMILPILLNADFITIFVWVSVVILNTTYAHSGIDKNEMHIIHHKIPFVNYGVLGFLDKFHGTYFQTLEID